MSNNTLVVSENRMTTAAAIIVAHSHPSPHYANIGGSTDGNGCYANKWSYGGRVQASPIYTDDDSSSSCTYPSRARLSLDCRRAVLKKRLARDTNQVVPLFGCSTSSYEDSSFSFSFDDDFSPDHELYVTRQRTASNVYSSYWLSMHQRQLSVPGVQLKSHSTPSSPKLASSLHSNISATKDWLNNNTIPVPTTVVRKYSCDVRVQKKSDEHQNLGRNFSLGAFSGSRRRLPPTPPESLNEKNLSAQNRTFRWSLPKMPPESEQKTSVSTLPESVSSSSTKTSDDGIFIRPGTGRKLPLCPDFSSAIKTEGYRNQCQQDELKARPCKTPPLSKCMQTSSCYGYQPELHANRASSPYNRKYCQRRTSEQSIDQYIGVPCTCSTPPPCFPISEHLESKSSSDTEDHATLSTLDRRDSSIDNYQIPILNLDAFEGGPDDKSYGLGRLLFSIIYFPIRKRLRVSIIKAENLGGRLKPELVLNTFLKICLMPGKIQKQRSTRIISVKGLSRDAQFNEEYFFDNVTMDDIKMKTVLIRICHRVSKQFQKDIVIGELDLSLVSLAMNSSKKEIKLCRELHPKVIKKLGRLHITTLLEREARRLTINILKVDNLPKYGITGAPDPCVRITVDQNNHVQTKQSRTLKSTCNASFREAVMFLVSTRLSDLENTTIDICIHDMARSSAGDDVIGRVVLGGECKEKVLIEHWRATFMNSGKEVKGSYTLRKDD